MASHRHSRDASKALVARLLVRLELLQKRTEQTGVPQNLQERSPGAGSDSPFDAQSEEDLQQLCGIARRVGPSTRPMFAVCRNSLAKSWRNTLPRKMMQRCPRYRTKVATTMPT